MTWIIQDHEQHERDQEEWLRTRPKCDECGEPIQDDHYFKIFSFIFCPSCIESFREEIE